MGSREKYFFNYSYILLILMLVAIFCSFSFSQSPKIDSLKSIVSSTSHDTIKINSLIKWSLLAEKQSLDSSIQIDNKTILIIDNIFENKLQPQEKQHYQKYLITTYTRIASKYNRNRDAEQALNYYQKAIDIATILNDDKSIADALHQMGNIHFNRGEMIKAFESYRVSLSIREEIDDLKGISASLNNIASVLTVQGDIENALLYHGKALKLKEELGDTLGIASSYNNLGIIHKNQNHLDLALEYYNRSAEIYRILGRKDFLSNTLINIGAIYLMRNDLDDALKHINESYNISYELDDKRGMATSFNVVGEIYLKQGEANKAIEHFYKSLRIREQLGDKRGVSTSLGNLTKVYLDQNNLQKALQYAKRTHKEATEVGHLSMISSGAQLLNEIYYQMGDYKNSRQYFEKHIITRDSLKQREYSNLAQKLHYKYEYEKRTIADSIAFANKIEINRLKLQRSEQIKIKQRIALIALGVVLVLVTVLIGIILRSVKQKNKSNRLIYQKNTLLEQANEELTLQSEILSQQKEEIRTQSEQLAETNKELEKLSIVASKTDSAILITNEKGHVDWINTGFTKITEYPISELVSKQSLETINSFKKIDALIQKCIRTSKTVTCEVPFTSKRNKEIWFQTTLTPVFDAQDKLSSVVAILSDITALKNTQYQLVQSEKMASIGVLTAGIAHEINNPINFVFAGVNSLMRDLQDINQVLKEISNIEKNNENPADIIDRIIDKKKEFEFDEAYQAVEQTLNDIKIGAERTADIVQGLRNFSRVENEVWDKTNVNKIIDGVLVLLKNKYKNNIKIVKQYQKDLPEIECKIGRINQVLMNIISNAIDAIEDNGKINISTKAYDKSVSISVKDTGMGIDDEVLSRIFDPFFTTKQVGQGVGLGLSITYGIIQEHGGEIIVNSTKGEGTEFVVSLPKHQ